MIKSATSLGLISFTLMFYHLMLVPPSLASSVRDNIYPSINEFPLPKSLSICGELIPLEDHTVRELLDREFTIAVWDRAQVFMWLKRAGRYFPYIERELKNSKMPDDLKYLAVAESSLLTHIKSRKGATGTWQFMTQTARRNGLRRDRTMDERRSFERSTKAALKYLKSLKDMFGTWTLAMAAYNLGEARLKKSIKEQKVNDYYKLDLPLETERFIFRIAAIKIVMEKPEHYGYNPVPERIFEPIECDEVQVRVSTSLHITDVAQALGIEYKTFKELNPQILGSYLPTGRYTVYVPLGLGAKLPAVLKKFASKPQNKRRQITGDYYVVQPGDTLTHIARQTGLSVATLKRINGISGSLIMVGQRLKISP